MPKSISDNKRIAKNTVMLYVRMLLSIVVSLYTSRVVLQTLGVEDYGIYSVVGGVVAMFGFLNASMSGATSRFLTFEMGRGDFAKLRDTFSSALIIHIGIALVVLVVAETVGLWFLTNKLVIPEERMFAAHVVYQLSIVSMMVGVTQVPYNASIIAHEKMDVYAYVELLNVFLKLGIVYLLLIGNFDKLILYAVLVLSVSVIVAFTYRIYCLRKFEECHFRRVWRKDILKPMLSFSGWDLYGNMSVTVRQQGINFLLNMFFGVAVNAAVGIATTIHGVLLGFSHNVITAFRPQIIKLYASKNIIEMQNTFNVAINVTLAIFLVTSVPLFFEVNYVLHLWLGLIPEHTVVFFRLILFSSFFSVVSSIIVITIHATGKIKHTSIITGSIYWISLIPVYVLLKLGYPPKSAYYVYVASALLILCSNTVIAKRKIRQVSFYQMLILAFAKNVPVIILISIIIFHIQQHIYESFFRLCVTFTSGLLLYILYFYFVILTENQRAALFKWVKEKLHA